MTVAQLSLAISTLGVVLAALALGEVAALIAAALLVGLLIGHAVRPPA